MNAYELEELLEKLTTSTSGRYSIYAIDMLRQQADRIEELEKGLEGTIGYHCYQAGKAQTKPLSDEEMYEILYKTDWSYDPIQFGRAIEERHGIK